MRVLISGASGLLGTALTARSAKREATRRSRWCGARRRRRGAVGSRTSRSIRRSWRDAMRWCIWRERTLPGAGPKSSSRKFWRAGRGHEHVWRRRLQRVFGEPGSQRDCVGASGSAIYGNRGDELLTEDSVSGHGISGGCLPAVGGRDRSGERSGCAGGVNLRIGVVLARDGGALKPMLLPFRLGTGRKDRQRAAVVELDRAGRCDRRDGVRAAERHPAGAGECRWDRRPCAMRISCRRWARLLHRPTIFPLPEFVIRTVIGEMGEELLLSSARILPAKLNQAGYKFKHAELHDALRAALGRRRVVLAFRPRRHESHHDSRQPEPNDDNSPPPP